MSKEHHTGNTNPGAVDLSLAKEFPPHKYADWKVAAEALLEGAPFEKKLVTRTWEGFDVQPLYTRENARMLAAGKEWPGAGARVRGGRASGYLQAPWAVSQEFAVGTPEAFNKLALRELCLGVTELNVVLDGPSRAGLDPDGKDAGDPGFAGLSLASLEDMDTALKGVFLEHAPIYWHAGSAGLAFLGMMVALAGRRKVDLTYLRGCVAMDPLGYAAGVGQWPRSLDAAYDEMAAAVAYVGRHAPGLQVVAVEGRPYHRAGASSAQEMAYVLAGGCEYLRALTRRGLGADQVAPHVRLSLSVGQNFFIEIAKFRAMRALWSRLLEGFGVPESGRGVHLHARTGDWNKTACDPYVNLLRVTTEAFSAVAGGCDSLHVSPFDESVREPDEFSRRIARNVQIILAEECDLTRVIDPAGGSWAVETLTAQMADEAWKLFQEIERGGGLAKALAAGLPQQACAEKDKARRAALRQRREVLVGVNQYPNATEKPLEGREVSYSDVAGERWVASRARHVRADEASLKAALQALATAKGEALVAAAVEAVSLGATLGEVTASLSGTQTSPWKVAALPARRGSEDFEELREAARAFKDRTGTAPRVFQANIGPSRKYRIRADWTSAFMQVGGFEVLADRDFDSPEAAAEAALACGASIIVITSDDETYATGVVPCAKALRSAGSSAWIMVAGLPGEHEASWREAGVNDFVNVRVNTYDLLKTLLAKIGAL